MPGSWSHEKQLAFCDHFPKEGAELSEQIDRQEMAMRYLLGRLSEEEEAPLEERYFSEDDEFEELEAAEDELIDRYVRGQLSDEDSRRFRRLLVSPRLAERVELAKILAQRTSSQTQPQAVVEPEKNIVLPAHAPSWWQRVFGTATAASFAFRPAFATAILLMLIPTTALVFVWMKLRTESVRLSAEQQQRENLKRQIDEQQAKVNALENAQKQTQEEKDQLAKLVEQYRQQVEQQQQRPTAPLVLAFQLLPGTVRGDGGRKPITLHKGVSAVDLDLDVSAGEYPRYIATVQDKDGNTFSSCRNLIPRGGSKYIRCRVSAKLLPPGIYNVHVDGITSTGANENFQDFPFRVVVR